MYSIIEMKLLGKKACSLGKHRRDARCWRPSRRGSLDVWETHRVSITALTGENLFMGEAIIVCSGGRALAETRLG